MTIDVISEFISNVGFPIAVTGALFYQMSKTNEANLKTFNEFKEIIQSNTHSITEMRNIVKELKEVVISVKHERNLMEQRERERGVNNDL